MKLLRYAVAAEAKAAEEEGTPAQTVGGFGSWAEAVTGEQAGAAVQGALQLVLSNSLCVPLLQQTGDLVSTLMCTLPERAAAGLREAGVPAACVEAVQSMATQSGVDDTVDALLRALEALCDDPESTIILAEHPSLVATLSGMLPTAGVRGAQVDVCSDVCATHDRSPGGRASRMVAGGAFGLRHERRDCPGAAGLRVARSGRVPRFRYVLSVFTGTVDERSQIHIHHRHGVRRSFSALGRRPGSRPRRAGADAAAVKKLLALVGTAHLASEESTAGDEGEEDGVSAVCTVLSGALDALWRAGRAGEATTPAQMQAAVSEVVQGAESVRAAAHVPQEMKKAVMARVDRLLATEPPSTL